jgi:hypothetical protein
MMKGYENLYGGLLSTALIFLAMNAVAQSAFKYAQYRVKVLRSS